MRIAFMGTPDFAAHILKALLAAQQEVVLVVTQPDRPKGRHKEGVPSPVKQLAVDAGLSLLQTARVRDAEVIETIASHAPDVIVVAAFGQILPKALLALPKHGCVNVHASLLPAYRGAAPIQHAILRGEAVTGVTIMQMDEGLDTGDMLAKAEVPIAADETGGSLFDKLADCGAALLLATLPAIEAGTISPMAQPEESTTPYARMLRKEDGRIDWQQDAAVIERQVRAFYPWPCATTTLDGKHFKILAATCMMEDDEHLPATPGSFRILPDGGMLVRTGAGILCPTTVQMEGKKQMQTADFFRGYHLKDDCLR